MKSDKNKNGFTLAEVLITLTILGVVAAIAIPNMIRSYKMKAVETQLKKSYSDMDNAIAMACAENNTDLVHLIDKSFKQSNPDQFFAENYIEPYLRRNKKSVSKSDGNIFGPTYNAVIKDLQGNTSNYYSRLNPSLWIQYSSPNTSFLGLYFYGHTNNQNLATFVVDVNGLKGPNQIGYDIFYFSAVGSDSGDAFMHNQIGCGLKARKNYVASCTDIGYDCSCVLMKNNWKFPKNYPVKF